MDVDLSLMKQLLTLNEAIQDLKSQQEFRSRPSSLGSSRDLSGSECSVSETDMFGSLDDVNDDVFFKPGCVKSEVMSASHGNISGLTKCAVFEEQNSFDSGTYETF